MSDHEPDGVGTSQTERFNSGLELQSICFDGFQLEQPQAALLKEALRDSRGSLLAVVHPFMYQNEVQDSPQYLRRFSDYSQRLSEMLFRASERHMPIVIFQSAITSLFSTESAEALIKSAEESLREQLANNNISGNIFVVYTQADTPSPLMGEDFYIRLKQDAASFISSSGISGMVEVGDYVDNPDIDKFYGPCAEVDLPLIALAKNLYDLGVKKVIVSGSYMGSVFRGWNPSGEGIVMRQSGGSEEYWVRPRSYMYSRAFHDRGSLEKGSGCVFMLAEYLRRAGVRVGISSATFPETFPRKSQISPVVGTPNNRISQVDWWIDIGSKSLDIRFPADMPKSEKVDVILFLEGIRGIVLRSDFVALSEDQLNRLKKLENLHLIPDYLVEALREHELVMV